MPPENQQRASQRHGKQSCTIDFFAIRAPQVVRWSCEVRRVVGQKITNTTVRVISSRAIAHHVFVLPDLKFELPPELRNLTNCRANFDRDVPWDCILALSFEGVCNGPTSCTTRLKFSVSWASLAGDILVLRSRGIQYFELYHESLTQCSSYQETCTNGGGFWTSVSVTDELKGNVV